MYRLFLLTVGVLLLAGCVASKEEVNQTAVQEDIAETAMSEPAEETSYESTPGFTKTESGLQYKMLREGEGKSPKATSTVVCHYRGWLDNGQEFDSSYKRGEPTEFPLNGVIKGWTEGLQLLKEGGKIELEIPPKLGYGVFGQAPTIPGNARLHFEVELLEVK